MANELRPSGTHDKYVHHTRRNREATARQYGSRSTTTADLAPPVPVDLDTIDYNGLGQIEVVDGGITTAKIANGAVTNAKLANLVSQNAIPRGATNGLTESRIYLDSLVDPGDGTLVGAVVIPQESADTVPTLSLGSDSGSGIDQVVLQIVAGSAEAIDAYSDGWFVARFISGAVSTVAAVVVVSGGTGPAAVFDAGAGHGVDTATDLGDAVHAVARSNGRAGYFEAQGTKEGIHVVNASTGKAGLFQMLLAGATAACVEIQGAHAGPALYVNGGRRNKGRYVLNTNTTISVTDAVLSVSTLTAAVTLTLPLLSSVPDHWYVDIYDIGNNSATAGRAITLNANGPDLFYTGPLAVTKALATNGAWWRIYRMDDPTTPGTPRWHGHIMNGI